MALSKDAIQYCLRSDFPCYNLTSPCCYIWIESSQWKNWNNLFWRKVSLVTDPHFRDVGQRIAVFVVSGVHLHKIKEPSSILRVVWRQMTQLWKLTDLSTKIVISRQRTLFNKYQHQIVQAFCFFIASIDCSIIYLFHLLIMSVKAWIMKVIPEKCCTHQIRYVLLYCQV